ncbi:MAG: RNA pseudouridine synthase, partial [Rhodobacteraceae bacterium]|nr:RNA pseudouridine synthase [Paracoccaceae bacterium]
MWPAAISFRHDPRSDTVPSATTESTKAAADVRTLPAVPAGGQGERLDRWLARMIADLSRSRLKALIESGAVQIGAATTTDPAHKMRTGDIAVVTVPPPRPADPEPQAAELDIVYEDDHLIVVNKPAGMVVHPAAGNHDGTLVNALLAHCGESLKGIGGVQRPGIVHRIDKDTSGLLVAAKTSAAREGLS